MAFVDPAKPQRYTIGSVEPVNGINKDVNGARLLLMTISAYPVDCMSLFLSSTEDIALLFMS